MHRRAILGGLFLLLGRSLAAGHEQSTAPFREIKESSAVITAEGLASRETAPDDYKQLRAEALAKAEVRVTSRLKNPRLSSSGFDPAVLTTLEEQRVHLETEHPLRSGAGATDAGTKRGTSAPPAASAPNLPARPLVSLSPSSKQLPSFAACDEPAIRAVNGSRQSVIFTPRAPGNAYRIEGCSFGSARGHVQLEPRSMAPGQSTLPIVLQLDRSATAWSDREINVHLDPHLSGIPDSPVTLVIYAGNGQRIELPGCFFVAMRGEPQLLKVIPASWVRLHATTVHSRSIQQLEYVSPPVGSGEVPKDAAGTSALVIRSDSDEFAAGRDTYDFSHLGPGWAVDSVQLQTYSISCPADIAYAQSFGRWDVAWDQRSFTISWKGDACKSHALPFFSFNLSISQYAAKIWVIGPVGTQPVPGGLQR